MKKQILRFLCFCFAAIFIFAEPVQADSVADHDLAAWGELSAQSYLLMDADTEAVLSESNADQALPMASTTKIMTCIVALEQGDVNDPVTIPQEAVGIEGSSVYLVKGEQLTLLDLLYALMLESANDAAVAIALHISGSVSAFADAMNQKAQEVGLSNTHYVNPNGLQAEGHFSTARDLSLLMCYAMKNPVFADISATRTKNIPAPEGKSRYLSNHNRLLRTYEECIAGKTGFTKAAGRCLVTAARRDGKTLVCTTLGDPNDWQDHKSLFDYGFSLYSHETIAEPGELIYSLPVVGGNVQSVSVTNDSGFSLSLRKEDELSSYVELPLFVYAPMTEGEQIGEAVYTLNEREVARIPLYTVEDVAQREVKLTFWQKIWNQICEWLDLWKK